MVGKAGNAQPVQMDPHMQAALFQTAGSSFQEQPRALPQELLCSSFDVTNVVTHALRQKLKGTGRRVKKEP